MRHRLLPTALVATTTLTAAALAMTVAPTATGMAGAATPAVQLKPFASGLPGQTKPDDVTTMNGLIYVAFQNNAGKDGTPAGSMSTIVAFDHAGRQAATYSVVGRNDGLTADPGHNRLFATVNEDNNSSLYVITPGSAPVHYTYSPDPSEQAAGETSSNGGTDSVSIGPDGTVYVAHSNPDPGVGNTAAAYTLTLSGSTASLTRLFGVQDSAAVVGSSPPATATLNLTDPDSNSFVPPSAPVLGGTLIQDSQADSQLVLVANPATPSQSLSVLNLKNATGDATVTPQLDDITEVTGPGTLFVVDQANGTISTVDTAGSTPGTLFVSQPAPSTGDLPNTPDLGVVDPSTGVVTHLGSGLGSPKGLLFVARTSPTLIADPAVLQIGPSLQITLGQVTAHLQSGNEPVPGETVSFTAGGSPICQAVTDATGTATCAAGLSAVLGFGYQATFAGDTTFASATAHGSLITIFLPPLRLNLL